MLIVKDYVKYEFFIISVVEAVWPFLRDLYNPWILPYSQRTVQQDCAQWIQQMNFDSASVLSPWIATDSNFAALFMSDFTDSVLFLAETLPGIKKQEEMMI